MGTLPILGIKETCLYVADTERTRIFYADRLGLDCFEHIPGVLVFFRAGNSVLLCFDPEKSNMKKDVPRHFGTGELHFAFEVPKAHYAAWRSKVVAAGISVEHDHVWPRGHRSFYFRDPDRHCVELIEAGLWEA